MFKSNLKYKIVAILSLILLCTAQANNSKIQNALSNILKDIKEVSRQDPNISIYLREIGQKKPLYVLHDARYMTPASTNKILTTYLFLTEFNEKYQFETKIYKQGQDVYLKFSGDPNLTSANLERLVKDAKLGNEIKGNLVIDDSLFAEDYYADGVKYDDLKFHYSAPIYSIILDKNVLSAKFLNKLLLQDELMGVVYKNKLIDNSYGISEKNDSCNFHLFISGFENPHFNLASCHEKNKEYNMKLANLYPKLTILNVIKSILKQNAIKLEGDVVFGTVKKNAILLNNHKSILADELIKDLMHSSDNLKADILFKTLLTKQGKKKINFNEASSHANSILSKILNNFNGYMADGSGLSSYNYITTGQMSEILEDGYKKFGHKFLNYFPQYNQIDEIFISTLTKNNRTMEFKEGQKLFVKTGSLPKEGVHAICGFLIAEDKIYVLSVMMNNYYKKDANMPRGSNIIDIILKNILHNI